MIAEALAAAKAERAIASKAERCAAYRAEALRARLAADSGEKVCIAAVIKLAESLAAYAREGDAEREAVAGIVREGGGPIGCVRRSVSVIENAAMEAAGKFSSFEIRLPVAN